MRTAAALSRTAEAGLAAVEAADAVAAQLTATAADPATVADPAVAGAPRCDLVVVTVTPAHADHLADVVAAVEARLEPGVLLAAVAAGVLGTEPPRTADAPVAATRAREVLGDEPAVSVWALVAPGGWFQPFRAWTLRPSGGGVTVAGWPPTEPGDTILVLADPHDFPAAEVVARLAERHVDTTVLGALVSGGPGRTHLAVDGRRFTDGAVGVVLRDVDVTPVLSTGCRPIGRPVTVTEVLGDEVRGLAGRAATDHLDALLRTLPEEDLALLERGGLQYGTVLEDVADTYRAGDFVLRGVIDVDPELGAVTVGERIPPGATLQFHLRDPVHAGIDLTARLRDLGPAAGALVFTCLGRGPGLFGTPHHDARAVAHHLDVAVAGVAGDGELGPLGGRNVLQGFSAVVAVFGAAENGADEGVTR